MQNIHDTETGLLDQLTQAGERFRAVRDVLSSHIYGQEQVIEQVLITLLAGGHGLLVGVPGLAKTRIVSLLGGAMGMDASRVQFTPDLMPSDILGSEVLEESQDGKRHFRFLKGPVFCQLLMADEINRASPRTQSALLQAMQELQVSVAGHNHPLPPPFHVLATQNPIEQEGTYPLPEAQLDRFLMQIDIDYPDRDAEKAMLLNLDAGSAPAVAPVMDADALMRAQRATARLPVGEQIVDAILDITRNARPETSDVEDMDRLLAWGPGPRASQSLMTAVKARAVLDGRKSPSLDDVAALAKPILKHRIALTFAARSDGETLDSVMDRLLVRLT